METITAEQTTKTIQRDQDFYKEIDSVLEKYLKVQEGNLILRILDKGKDKILTSNYDKILFDADLNFYKKDDTGKLTKVENDNFKVIVMKKQAE